MKRLLFALSFAPTVVLAQLPSLTLEQLPRPTMPPGERGPVVPAQVERWRQEAKALEYGDGVKRDEVAAARRRQGIAALRDEARARGGGRDFVAALGACIEAGRPAVIAEVKKAMGG